MSLARRLASAVLTLLFVSVLVFCLIHVTSGDPLGPGPQEDGLHRLDPEVRQQFRDLYHLDEPLLRQYGLWLSDVMRGELGRSFHDRRPVAERIGERIGVTLLLNGASLGLMLLLAVPLGVGAALHPGSLWDRLTGAGTYLLYAMPTFWTGLLLQLLLSARLDWLPLAGLRSEEFEFLGPLGRLTDRAAHLVLPVTCMSYGGLAYLSRFVRASLIENAAHESWRAARARGLSSLAVLCRHGFRQAGVPLLTLAGFLVPALVSGSVIVETIFAIPGLGRLFFEAALQRDTPVLMGLTLLSGMATLAGIVAADVAYALVDPRIRRG